MVCVVCTHFKCPVRMVFCMTSELRGQAMARPAFMVIMDSGFPVLYSELLLNCLLEVVTAWCLVMVDA